MSEKRYCEDNMVAKPYRDEYTDSLARAIAARRSQTDVERAGFGADLLQDPTGYRQKFVKMLGWPLTEYVPKIPPVKKIFVAEEDGVSIYRLQLEIFPDFHFYGLLFLQKDTPRPLVISQHGGAGTPELCSSMLPMGSVNYNEMTRRVLAKGANVFAPQLFLWDPALFGEHAGEEGKTRDELRRQMDATLKNLGGSMMAMELYCLRRSLDYLETQIYVQPQHIGMVGLSYGGQYALFAPAVETRIKASLSSCFFNDRHGVEWPDYTWFGAAQTFFDAEIALLTHPRKLYIQVARRDSCFPCGGAEREYQRLLKLCNGDTAWLDFEVFDGEHEFNKSDRQLDSLMSDLA